MYCWPFISVVSVPTDSTNYRLKIFGKKIQKVQKFRIFCVLATVYITFTSYVPAKLTSVVSDSLRPCGFVACQPPLSLSFSKQEYWSGFSFSSPGDLPYPGIEPESPASPALAGGFFTTSTTWEARLHCIRYYKGIISNLQMS